MRTGILYTLLFALTLFWTCGKQLSLSSNAEGMIFYDISYPREEGILMTELMPREMVMKFKNDQIFSELKSIGGLMSITISADNDKKEFVQILKDFDKRYGMKLDERKVSEWNDRNPEIRVELQEGTEWIAGYNCRKAMGRFVKDTLPSIELFYTEDIQISSPNWFNPYNSVPGVLMGYDIEYLGMRMRFRAREVRFTPIDANSFEVKTPFEAIDTQKMDDVCNQLMVDFRN
jgi:GLPGLI family protein